MPGIFSVRFLRILFKDIDERRSLKTLQAVVRAAPIAVVGTDSEGRLTSWNPAAAEIFGWNEKEVLGTHGLDRTLSGGLEQLGWLRRALEGETTKGFESVGVNRAGRTFPVSISAAPLRDETGRLTGAMATMEDISERKRAEGELNEKTVTLTAVTDALNTFLESGDWATASKRLLAQALKQTKSPCGLLGVVLEGPTLRVLAHDGVVWDANENRELYEAKRKQQAELGYFDLTHRGNLFGEIINGKTVVSNQPSSDVRASGMPPGHPRIYSLLGVPILKGSTVVGVIAIANRAGGYTGEEARSLTTISRATGVLYDSYRQNLKGVQAEEHRLRVEEEFRQVQKMEVMGQLSGGIAHDFNNMLMVLSGSTELLERSLTPESPGIRYVEQIRRTVDKAAAITKHLLAFSRKQVLHVTPVDLHEVLTESEFMLPRLLGSDVQLTFRHAAARSWIRADAAQLEQVIANLAVNSRDAMPDGGMLTISTHNTVTLPEGVVATGGNGLSPTEWVVLEVRDTGTGMDEETRARIFEPFFTTKPQGKGTGLGLPTVYGIVHQFGGHIQVESKKGEGTRFAIYFPARSPAEQIEARTTRRSPPLEREAALTILFADDEPSLRAAVTEYLRESGHQVLEAQSAHDALELARSYDGPIDLLLTDVIMPGLRGTELANEVQKLRPEVHVIYISGNTQNLREAQIPKGAVFLQKPFRLATLAEQLKLVPRKV